MPRPATCEPCQRGEHALCPIFWCPCLHVPPETAQNGTSRGPAGSSEGDSTTATENEPQREPER